MLLINVFRFREWFARMIFLWNRAHLPAHTHTQPSQAIWHRIAAMERARAPCRPHSPFPASTFCAGVSVVCADGSVRWYHSQDSTLGQTHAHTNVVVVDSNIHLCGDDRNPRADTRISSVVRREFTSLLICSFRVGPASRQSSGVLRSVHTHILVRATTDPHTTHEPPVLCVGRHIDTLEQQHILAASSPSVTTTCSARDVSVPFSVFRVPREIK